MNKEQGPIGYWVLPPTVMGVPVDQPLTVEWAKEHGATFYPVSCTPSTKHDGWLDEKHEYEVSHWQPQSKTPRIYIEETSTIKDEPEFVGISPAQALSLLAWLKQEEAELQRLAKEQEG